MAYKEKQCPKCGVKHTKRGEFCSRSCGNSRAHTPEQSRKIGEKRSAWLTSGDDEAEVQKHNFTSQRTNAEPDPVPPPARSPLKSNQFVQDGDLWNEV
jgi:hypothetical protein